MCTHLGLENITNLFHGLNKNLDLAKLKFYTEKAEGTVNKAESLTISIFETSCVRTLDSELLVPIISEFLHEQFVFHNSVIRLDTENIKIKEILKIDKHISIYLRVQFQNPGTQGILVCKDATRVIQSYIKTSTLPRNLLLHPGHSLQMFNKLTGIINRNLSKDLERRLRCSILLSGEEGSGKLEFCQYLAENTGLGYAENCGRDLVGDTPAITEGNILKAVTEVNSCMPTIWVIRYYQGCIIRLLTVDALQCTGHVVSLAYIDKIRIRRHSRLYNQ